MHDTARQNAGADVRAFEAHLERWLARFTGSSPAFAMMRYHFGLEGTHLRRGKRLRPQLVMLVAQEEGVPADAVFDAAAAIEILHNYSLVHDDIEDRDEMRHGRPTVWKTFGEAQGINTGDAMCAMSYLALLNNEAGHAPERVLAMSRVLQEAHLAMCAGQGLDIAFESTHAVSPAQYRTMIEGKTAALFGAACALGALAAGASEAAVAAYGRLGRQYGLAFQVQDDILGIWGAPQETGKPSGADIARRKWTFPIVWALAQAGGCARNAIAQAYAAQRELETAQVQAVIAALDEIGARAAADAACDAYLTEAQGLAEDAGIDRDRALRGFFAKGTRRNV